MAADQNTSNEKGNGETGFALLVKIKLAGKISRTEKPDKCHFDNSIEFFYNHAAITNIPMIGRAFS